MYGIIIMHSQNLKILQKRLDNLQSEVKKFDGYINRDDNPSWAIANRNNAIEHIRETEAKINNLQGGAWFGKKRERGPYYPFQSDEELRAFARDILKTLYIDANNNDKQHAKSRIKLYNEHMGTRLSDSQVVDKLVEDAYADTKTGDTIKQFLKGGAIKSDDKRNVAERELKKLQDAWTSLGYARTSPEIDNILRSHGFHYEGQLSGEIRKKHRDLGHTSIEPTDDEYNRMVDRLNRIRSGHTHSHTSYNYNWNGIQERAPIANPFNVRPVHRTEPLVYPKFVGDD